MMDLDQAPDPVLVVAVGRWYEPALGEIFRRHGAAVHALAGRLLRSAAAADDITQEVFLRLWQAPERFDPSRGSLRSLLLITTHGRAIDQLREQAARAAREERSGRQWADEPIDVERLVADLLQDGQVRRAVDALPERSRQPIVLAYFQGHSYKEVSVLLGESEGTIKGRIRSGLAHLRQVLEQQLAVEG
jgi:RNA polymerase sigma-70 factor, ECF subfamily